jgi:hypothetical protein
MTVRKNFVFDEEVAEHLAELAKQEKKSQTAFVQELIENRYRSEKVRKRKEAFRKTVELADREFAGLLVGKSVQSIKAEMDV